MDRDVTPLTYGVAVSQHNPVMRKKDSSRSTYFRSGDRVFCLNGDWFYQTREDDHGPFTSREAAELDMKRYIEEMSFFDGITPGVPSKAPANAKSESTDLSLIDKD